VDKRIYYIAPLLSFVPALLGAAVIPFGPAEWTRVVDLKHSLLFSFALSSLSVYAVTLGGWSSNNKYSLLGALRAAAQMISYELGMGLALIAVVMTTSSLSLAEIVERQHLYGWNIWGGGNWFLLPFMLLAFWIYGISGVAETNRAPFDLAEAETELTAGFHTEYSAFKFAMFYMAEYVAMVIISSLVTTLFLGGWSGPGVSYALNPATGRLAIDGGIGMAILGVFWFLVKMFGFLFFYFWLRASLPRFRYDQLMNFGWKRLVPLGLANLFCIALIVAWRSNWF
jgi:NADH-quinone oxidoreductase subunit H